MIESLRSWYNAAFSQSKYEHYKEEVKNHCGEEPLFHLAETPVFIPKEFKAKLLQACDDLIDMVSHPDFVKNSEKAITPDLFFANDPGYSPMMVFDFGVCENETGELEPQLIEMQGFPSLYCFQIAQAAACRDAFGIPDHLDNYIDITAQDYIDLLKKIIIGDADPNEVILLDYKPEEQKTKVDFAATKKYLGIDAVCVTKLIQEGRELFYMKGDIKQKISRIYNRLIFDEFFSMNIPAVDLRQDLDVTWYPHPNWFCRISKYSLPFIKSDFVPQTTFVSDLKSIPDDLEHYVLKPVYSYAGMGVVIDVTKKDIESIKEPAEWILQKKVHYHPAIQTPDVPAKCEIRMMLLWESKDKRPRVVHNLARLSKGKMIGVRYNADFKWVGSSICFLNHNHKLISLVDLVTSVPDLHTARILASGGVSFISLLQTNPNLNEIIPWIAGPEIFVQLTDPDLPVPQVQGLIIPYEWYDQFSFMNKKIFWMTDRPELADLAGIICTDRDCIPLSKDPVSLNFYHYSLKRKYEQSDIYTWIDFEQDLSLFENLFLD